MDSITAARPHSHPNQHIEVELTLISNMHRRNSKLEVVAAVRNGKWGYIDTNGKQVIPCEYDDARYGEGYFTLLKGGRLTIISRDEL